MAQTSEEPVEWIWVKECWVRDTWPRAATLGWVLISYCHVTKSITIVTYKAFSLYNYIVIFPAPLLVKLISLWIVDLENKNSFSFRIASKFSEFDSVGIVTRPMESLLDLYQCTTLENKEILKITQQSFVVWTLSN